MSTALWGPSGAASPPPWCGVPSGPCLVYVWEGWSLKPCHGACKPSGFCQRSVILGGINSPLPAQKHFEIQVMSFLGYFFCCINFLKLQCHQATNGSVVLPQRPQPHPLVFPCGLFCAQRRVPPPPPRGVPRAQDPSTRHGVRPAPATAIGDLGLTQASLRYSVLACSDPVARGGWRRGSSIMSVGQPTSPTTPDHLRSWRSVESLKLHVCGRSRHLSLRGWLVFGLRPQHRAWESRRQRPSDQFQLRFSILYIVGVHLCLSKASSPNEHPSNIPL